MEKIIIHMSKNFMLLRVLMVMFIITILFLYNNSSNNNYPTLFIDENYKSSILCVDKNIKKELLGTFIGNFIAEKNNNVKFIKSIK